MPEPETAPSPNLEKTAKAMGDRFRSQMSDPPTTTDPTPPTSTAKTDKTTAPPGAPVAKKPDPPEKKTKEQNFAELNKHFDDFRAQSETRIKELEAAIENSKKSWSEEKGGLEPQLKQYQEIVQRVSLENDPRFKAAFDSRIHAALADAKESVGSAKAAAVEAAFNMPEGETRDARIKEIASELDEFEKMGLRNSYDNFKRAQRERKAELAKAPENLTNLQKLDQKRAEETQQARKKELGELFNTEVAQFAQGIPDFAPDLKDEAHNKIVADTIGRAKQWLDGELSNLDTVRLALWASKGINAVDREKALSDQIAKLQKQVADLTAAHPRANGTGRQREPNDTKRDRPGQVASSVADKYRQAMEQGLPES